MELVKDGIVTTTAEALLGSVLWSELREAASAMVDEAAPSRWLIDLARTGAPQPTIKQAKKPYLVRLLSDWPVYDSASIWGRVAEAERIQDLAWRYLPAPPHVNAWNLWLTVPSQAPPSDSQLWHRDVDDRSIFKVFLYLTDVTAAAGPLTYLPGTHAGRNGVCPETTHDYANIPRATDAQMAAVAAPTEWIVATGHVGTATIVDTSGWHKGGHGTVERLVFTAMYTTHRDLGYFGR